MALKPKIYKIKIALSDIDRNYYDTLNLTLAQHPSETPERMMARVLAFCINAHENLSFTKGLAAVEEPDIWLRSLDDRLSLWIDVGEPAFDRIKKATRISEAVRVYTFNSKSASWWSQEQEKFDGLDVSVFQFQWEAVQTLTELVTRSMDFSMTVTGDVVYISSKDGDCEVAWTPLQTR